MFEVADYAQLSSKLPEFTLFACEVFCLYGFYVYSCLCFWLFRLFTVRCVKGFLSFIDLCVWFSALKDE